MNTPPEVFTRSGKLKQLISVRNKIQTRETKSLNIALEISFLRDNEKQLVQELIELDKRLALLRSEPST